MKEIISEQEIKKFNYYGSIYTVHLAVLIIVDRHDVRIRECLTDFFNNTLTNDMVR